MNWWQRLFRRNQLEKQLDAELRYHVERTVAELVRQGVPEAEARRQARLDFGGLDQVKEECREARGTLWVESTWADVRLAWRSWRKSPGFALAAVASLALGIGANTAIFSALYPILLKPLPYANPDRVVGVLTYSPQVRSRFPFSPVRPVDFEEFRRSNTVLAGLSILQDEIFSHTGQGEAERLNGTRVSASFFDVLGVSPALGRTFLPEEDEPGRDKVVVIGYDLWVRRFGSDPGILGRAVRLDGQPHTVIGVMPAGFRAPNLAEVVPWGPVGVRPELWKPIAFSQEQLHAPCCWNYGLLGRLKPGLDRRQAEKETDLIAARIAKGFPEANIELRTELRPIREVLSGKTGQRLLLVQGAVGLLLAIACVSLANLLLARAGAGTRELATRAALGASRARLVRQLLTESVGLAVLGAAAGLAVAHWGTRLLVWLGPADSPALQAAGLSGPVLLFTLFAAVLTGILFGVIPAVHSVRQNLAGHLQGTSRGSTASRHSGRLQRTLVALEVALSTGLLACGGLLLHSFAKVLSVDKGFVAERVLTADLLLSGERYTAPDAVLVFHRELNARIRRFPGVLAVGAANGLPLGEEGGNTAVYLETDVQASMDHPPVLYRAVTPGYFGTLGIPLLAGRSFEERESSPVAAVSAELAKRLWPGEPLSRVVGQRVRVTNVAGPLITITGVIGDVRTGGLEGRFQPTIYFPHAQHPYPRMSLVIRTTRDPAPLAAAIRGELRAMDPNLPIPRMQTMREIASASVAERRFLMVLIVGFAVLALVLALVGIYGVTSFAAARRTREIGLRMALGAPRSTVLGGVLLQGLQPVLAGLVLGLAAASLAAASLRSLLFGIGPLDPAALVLGSGLLLLTAGLACFVPARLASRVDPAVVLRCE